MKPIDLEVLLETEASIIGEVQLEKEILAVINNENSINVTVESIGGTGVMYTHPDTHPASMIVESEDRMFVTSTEKSMISYTFVHEQILPEKSWIVNHNLGRNPSVTIVDSSGNSVVGDVVYLNGNSIQLMFSSEFSGRAYLNYG